MSSSNRLDLDQIASAAQVSPLAVWQRIFGDSRKLAASEIVRLQKVLVQPDYARLLPPVGSPVRAIGVVVPSGTFSARQDFAGCVLRAFFAEAEQTPFTLKLHHQWADFVPDLGELFRDVHYVVLIAAEKTQALIEACEALARPYVLVETEYRKVGPSGVTLNTDNRAAIQAALDHLFALGHRRIGFIMGRRQNRSSQERLAAYQAALEAAGIDPAAELVYPGTWLETSGYDGARALLALPQPPTAIVAANDTMALGVLRAARVAGLTIGADLSVVGFDDIEQAAQVAPPLTTLRQPLAEMGRLALDQVRAFAAGQRPDGRTIPLSAALIVRASTGPAPER